MPKLPIKQKGTIVSGPGGDALQPSGGMLEIPTATEEIKDPVAQSNAVKASVDQSGFTPSGLFINSDGTIDFSKSLDNIKTTTTDIQTKAAALTEQNKPDTSAFVSSSEPIVQEEKATTKAVSDLTPAPVVDGAAAAVSASDEYLALLDKQEVALESRRKQEVESLTAQFGEAKTGLLQAQKGEKGATAVGLARMGGFLGPSASHTGVLLNLAANHRAEVTTLEGKKAEAIRMANNAIDDKQFAIAKLRVEEVKDIEKTIHDRKVEFFNQSLDATAEARKEDEFFRKKVEDDLKTFGELSLADEALELDPAKASAIDDYYGVPGFTQQYLDVIKSSATAKGEKEALETKKTMLDFLEKIPQGQEVAFPDGTTYTGLGKAGDVYTTLQTDDAGFGRMVSVDKRTGEVTVTPVGQVGKTKTTGAGGGEEDLLFDTIIGNTSIALEATKVEGFYDPERYLDIRNELKGQYPEYLKELDKNFLNPANEFFTQEDIEELRKEGVTALDRF